MCFERSWSNWMVTIMMINTLFIQSPCLFLCFELFPFLFMSLKQYFWLLNAFIVSAFLLQENILCTKHRDGSFCIFVQFNLPSSTISRNLKYRKIFCWNHYVGVFRQAFNQIIVIIDKPWYMIYRIVALGTKNHMEVKLKSIKMAWYKDLWQRKA